MDAPRLDSTKLRGHNLERHARIEVEMMLKWILLAGMALLLGGCGAPEQGAREVPVTNRRPINAGGPPAVTKPARAIATH
jgi:hypothetical protein